MKRALPIILAVLLAVIAAGIVFFYTKGADQRVLDDQQPVSVLVSLATIPQGMSLGDAQGGGLVEQTQVPGDMAPAGAISEVTPENSILLSLNNVPPGQILLTSNFVIELPAVEAVDVPDGKIAISFVLGDPERVGGFVRPGSEIVVFDTYPSGATDAQVVEGEVAPVSTLTTRMLLDRIQVLAVGAATTAVPPPNPDGTPAPAPVPSAQLTIAVDQVQAEKLIQAIRSGHLLYLGLLGEGTEIVQSNGTTDGNLFD
jgi:pilus assembly protein CpaB